VQFKNEIEMLMGGRIQKTAQLMENIVKNQGTLGIGQMEKSQPGQGCTIVLQNDPSL
jgi:hypothetical protein